MCNTKLRPFIVKVSVLGYFPLHYNYYFLNYSIQFYFLNNINTIVYSIIII